MDHLARLSRRLLYTTYHIPPSYDNTPDDTPTHLAVVWFVVVIIASLIFVQAVVGFAIHLRRERIASAQERRPIDWGYVLIRTIVAATFLWIPIFIYRRTCGRASRRAMGPAAQSGTYSKLQDPAYPQNATTWYGAPIPASAAASGNVPLANYGPSASYDSDPHSSTSYGPQYGLSPPPGPPAFGGPDLTSPPPPSPHWQSYSPPGQPPGPAIMGLPHQPPPHHLHEPTSPFPSHSHHPVGLSPALQ